MKPTYFLSSLFIISFLCVSCGDKITPQDPIRPIKAIVAGEDAQMSHMEFTGVVQSATQSESSFEVSGKIVKLDIKEGDEFKKGDILAQLDDSDYQSNLKRENAKFKAAEEDFKRKQDLFKKGVLEKIKYEQAEQQIDVAKANLEKTQKALNDCMLKASFDGQVGKILVNNFTNIQAKQTIFILQDNSSLEVVIDVPESVIIKGKNKMTKEEATELLNPFVMFNGLPNKHFPARFSEFATTPDKDTRTYPITLTIIDSLDAKILPGMSSKVLMNEFIRDINERQIRVPSQCVISDENKAFMVWVIDKEQKAKKRLVQTGKLQDGMIEITDGLNKGEMVALSGVHKLRENMPVTFLK